MRKLACSVGFSMIGLLACSSSDEPAIAGDSGALEDAEVDSASDDVAITDSAIEEDSGMVGDSPVGDSPAADAVAADTKPGVDAKAPVDCKITKDSNGFFKLTSAKSDYWARLPPGYEAAPKSSPLLLGFHGCGDKALNFATWAIVPYALRATQSYIGVSLGGRESACWDMTADPPLAMAAIEHLQSCFMVDQKKIVLAGYSSGGMLAYAIGMKNAAKFAGILIENSGLSQGVGGKVDSVLAAAAWKINVAHTAHTEDDSFAIAGVRSDRDKMLAAGFPLLYREGPGTHDGTSDDWALYLIPKMATWSSP